MIRIQHNDQNLDLGKISMTFSFSNPMFSDNAFNEGYSFPFKLPITARNIAVLNNSDRLDNRVLGKKFQVKIYIQNTFAFSGVLIIKTYSNGQFNCHFNSSGLNLKKDMRDKNLRKLTLLNKTVWVDTDTMLQRQDKWENHVAGYSNIFETLRPDEEMTHYFPPIHNQSAYDEERGDDIQNSWWSNYTNFYLLDQDRYLFKHRVAGPVYSSKPGWLTSITPCPAYLYVLRMALEELGITLEKSGVLTNDIIKNLFIYSNEAMNQVELDGGYYYNIYGASYDLAKFLPDLDTYELLIGLKQMFNTVFFENNGKIKTITIAEILSQVPEDLTRFTDSAFVAEYFEKVNYSFNWLTDDDKAPDIYTEQFAAYETDPDTAKTEPHTPDKIRPLATIASPRVNVAGTWMDAMDYVSVNSTDPVTLVNGANKTGLTYKAPVRTTISETSPKDILKTLLVGVYRGGTFYPEGFPSAVNQSVDDLGVKFGDQSILWANDDGLVKNHFTNYIEFLNDATRVDVKLYLPPHKIAELATFEQPVKKIETPKGNINGILSGFRFTVTADAISPIDAEFVVRK